MMFKRFFVLLFSPHTYEIRYTMEVFRLVLIILVEACLLFFLNPNFNPVVWTYAPIVFVFIFFGLLFWMSYSRLFAIHYFKKNAILITLDQLKKIIILYPNEIITLMVNNKYVHIKPKKRCDLFNFEKVLLISIGKKPPFYKKRLKEIIQTNTK